MPRRASSQPTDGELEILQVLWEFGPTRLGDLCAKIRQHRDVATTTVATMLRVMLDKGLVKRQRGTRGYRWSAAVTRRAAEAGIVGSLLDRLFDGSASRLVTHLVESGRLSEAERAEVRRLLQQPQSPQKKGRR